MADNLTTFMCLLSPNLRVSTSWTLWACSRPLKGIALHLHTYESCIHIQVHSNYQHAHTYIHINIFIKGKMWNCSSLSIKITVIDGMCYVSGPDCHIPGKSPPLPTEIKAKLASELVCTLRRKYRPLSPSVIELGFLGHLTETLITTLTKITQILKAQINNNIVFKNVLILYSNKERLEMWTGNSY